MSTLPPSGGLACQRTINARLHLSLIRVHYASRLRHTSISGLLRVFQARCQPSPPLTHMYSSPGGKIVDPFGARNVQFCAEGEDCLQVLDVRFQFLEAHRRTSFDGLASSIAPKNPHPYASHTFLLTSHFKSIIPKNVILPRGCLDNRQRRMQRTPARRGQVNAFNVMVSRNNNISMSAREGRRQ
jgi:hypothetical protein